MLCNPVLSFAAAEIIVLESNDIFNAYGKASTPSQITIKKGEKPQDVAKRYAESFARDNLLREALLNIIKKREKGNTSVVPVFISAYKNCSSWEDRVLGFNLFGELGPSAKITVPILINIISDNEKWRDDIIIAACNALGKIGSTDPKVISELERLKEDKSNELVSQAAVKALSIIKRN